MATGDEKVARALFHFRFGWWSLLLFACIGLTLEAMHGFKLAWYLDVSNETRRLMLRLCHAHGGLLGLVHLGYGATLQALSPSGGGTVIASRALVGASALLPLGFALAGVGVQGGDPGPAIALVPVGALCLLTGLFAAGWSLRRVGGS
jgi:hypothetical protein